MAIIMGALFPTKGTGRVFDHPLATPGALKELGYSPEFTSFYSDMSCVEYLYYMATLAGLSSDEAIKRTNELLDQFDLKQHANRKVAKFSTGMKKKVSLAQSMIHRPKVLLLDEPTANLDPTSRQEILDTVRKMVEEENLTVLISSHVLTELETIINHVIMIDHGHIILDAPIHEAQEKFKQGILLVDTSNNDLVLEKLANRYEYRIEEEDIRFNTIEIEQLKKDIVGIVYNENLTLNMLKEEVLSLDSLYKQIMEGETKNEGNTQKNA
jgi:ABC-2 type transport system ATP-binding protein